MRSLIAAVLLTAVPTFCRQAPEQSPDARPKLRTRTELPADAAKPEQPIQQNANGLWIVPAGTKIPIQLRQAISTKNAQVGDPIYAQTTFPIVADGVIMIPAGTYVKGVVDSSKRAGRIKGSAELQFHLTTLIYPNGYTLDLAAAIDQVPGNSDSRMKEPGTVKHDPEKGADLKRVGEAAATGGQIGGMAGATSGSVRGIGIGGLSGIAAGSLIGLLARGSDVRFDIGSGVEVSLNHAIAVDANKVMRAGMIPASSAPAPVITAPVVTVPR
jgi:type IV secretion system protein VirB10